jgi:AraC family transcriptional regulator
MAATASMDSRRLVPAGRVSVFEHRCSAGPTDRPYEEEHTGVSLGLVVAGAFRYRTPRGTASLGPGAILLGNAGERYVCSHELGCGDLCIGFSLRPDVPDAVASQLGVSRASFTRVAAPPMPALAGVWARAIAAARGAPHAPSPEEAAYEMLAAVLTAQSDRARAAALTARDEQRAADAMRWLDEHATDAVSLDDAAGAVGVGAFHFLRTFRRVVGVTPHQYLVGARLRRAAALLLESDRAVTDVAFDAGFGDLSNFIRTFRRATGASPRAFRAAPGSRQVKIRQVRAAADR